MESIKFFPFVILILVIALAEALPWATEREVRCKNPGIISDGFLSPFQSFHSVGSVVHYRCVPGYRMNGTATLTCMSNGHWSDDIPSCEENDIRCKNPGKIANGAPRPPQTFYSVSEVIHYRCLPGYQINGTASITCTDSGNWSHELPECIRKEVSCQDPGQIKNGRLNDPKGTYSVGSVVTYQCLPGFEIQGEASLTCNDNGNWSHDLPKCKRKVVTCKDPGRVKYGRRVSRKIYSVGSRILYRCLPGYKIQGKASIVCRSKGKWSHKAPSCKKRALRCKDPGKIKFGSRSAFKKTHRSGTKILYRCHPGHEINGTATISCMKNGNWSHEPPTCQPISCGKPSLIKHGNYTGNEYTYRSAVTYKCDVGYKLIGKPQRNCRSNGKWTKKPKCEIYKCRIRGTLRIRHGKIRTTDSTYSHGSTLLFKCHKGYELVGTDSIACLEGKWSARKLPYCKVKACPNPGFPDNGRRIGNNFRIGQTVRFTCQSGFKLTGSPVRTCLKDKHWSGSVAVCDDGSTDCPILGTPVSGIKIGNRYNFGSFVRFVCKEGYILQGSSTRRCMFNGKWNGTEAKCVDEFHYLVKEVNDTALTFRKNIDTLLEYTCSGVNSTCNTTGIDARARRIDLGNLAGGLDVLFVFDASSSIKKKEFKLAVSFTKTVVEQLGATWKPGGTRIAAIVYGTKPELIFNFGDHGATTKEGVLKKLDKIRKLGGGTATRAALEMGRTVVFVDRKSRRQRVMFFITDGRSNIGGSPAKAAQMLREEYGIKISAIGVGKDVDSKELYAIAYDKEDVIVVRNFKALNDAMEKAITTTYDYSPCGESRYDPRARMVGGNEADRGRWPWQVGIFTIGNDNEPQLQCGGALIHRRWVLTASHCFHLEKRLNIDPPNKYTVRAGDHGLSVQENSEQEKSASEIFIHEKYNVGTLENDVALVKLSESFTLGPFVRTICLPKMNEELLEPGKSGIVAGWGATQVLLPGQPPSRSSKRSKVLLQSAFTIQSNELCANKTTYRFNPNSVFCAGDGKGGNDTCKGDSGGSFVRHVFRDGTLRWVSAGLVSWGEGCGLKDKYGYYTRVAPFVDWIKKTMRKHNKD